MLVVGGCHYPPNYRFIQYPLWASPHGGVFNAPPQFYQDYAEARPSRERPRPKPKRDWAGADDFFREFHGGFFGFEARDSGGPPEPDYPYSVFGLPRSSSDGDVKKAYREAVLQAHPDKGGSAELFGRVREAWDHFVAFCRGHSRV